jgi:hypothetical protein
MKKYIITIILTAVSGALVAQTSGEDLGRIDNSIGSLATDIAQKLAEERVGTVMVGQFPYMGTANRFSAYLNSQLTEELSRVRGRSYELLSGGTPECMVSGEIVYIADVVRVYSRIVRREDREIVSLTHVDLELTQTISAMLSEGMNGGYEIVMPDEWESDDMDSPVEYDIQTGSNADTMNRTIERGDEDWFAISPEGGTLIVMETTGGIDTHMTLYDSATRAELDSNDDSDGSNARIRHFARAGESYLVKVRGYSSDTAGEYGFRAYTEEVGEAAPYQVHSDVNEARFVIGRLDDGGNMYLLTPQHDGTMVMETSGSNDVYLEFYDADTFEALASDDDSGYDNNARITYQVQQGRKYFAKVRGYSSDTKGEYGFKAYME